MPVIFNKEFWLQTPTMGPLSKTNGMLCQFYCTRPAISLISSQLADGLPCRLHGKEFASNAEDTGSIPGLGRSPGEEMATLSLLSGKSHGQRNQADYSPWGHKNQTRLSD